jgi:tryptophan-rich sensory protein
MNQIALITLSLVISFGVPSILGASYKYYKADWYKSLKRPNFAFPDIVFIVIFPIFYLLEAIGLFTLLTNTNVNNIILYSLIYLASAILNGLWSRLFFIYQRCDLSLWAFFGGFPFDWAFLYLLLQEKHLAWAYFIPRVIWGFYAIFANVQYYRLNKEFWDSIKEKKANNSLL